MLLLSVSFYQSTGPDKKEYTGVLLQQRWTKAICKVSFQNCLSPDLLYEDEILNDFN